MEYDHMAVAGIIGQLQHGDAAALGSSNIFLPIQPGTHIGDDA